MSDPTTAPTAGTTSPTRPSDTPAEDRGTLEVRTPALEHLVEAVVRRTPGTTSGRPGGRLGIGRSYPRVSVRLQGGRARVAVDLACVWPAPVTEIATDVRDRVLAEGSRLSGVELSDVDVTAHLVPADADRSSVSRAR